MALAQARAANVALRGLGPTFLVVAFVAAIFFATESSARADYPFLEGGPAPPPDVVYLPTYTTAGSRPVLMTVKKDHDGSVLVELIGRLSSGDELRIWESNRYDASPQEAVGSYVAGLQLMGALTTWTSGQTPDGRANLLYARIGSTLVVIVGALAPDQLLRIADSMRRSVSSALIL